MRRCCSTTSRTAKDSRERPQTSALRCCEGLPRPPAQVSITSSFARKTFARVNSNDLAREAVRAVRDNSSVTKLLINGRADIALACGADGVHLPSGELAASEIRALWMKCCHREPVIGVSAHSLADVREAEAQRRKFRSARAHLREGADRCERNRPRRAARGLLGGERAGRSSSARRFAVLALGGVNLTNARACLEAGAAGLAGIRLFQSGDLLETVRRLREVLKIFCSRVTCPALASTPVPRPAPATSAAY